MKRLALAMRKYLAAAAVGLAVAASLVAISELGYHRSRNALDSLGSVRALQKSADQLGGALRAAESAQRGYLLTGDDFYLQQFEAESTRASAGLTHVKQALMSVPDADVSLSGLESTIATKMSEMSLAVHLRSKGHLDALEFVTSSDVGRTQMSTIAQLLDRLDQTTERLVSDSQAQIRTAQDYSRVGLTLAAFTGLLAFLLYLRRSHQLEQSVVKTNAALQQERERLEDLVRERTRNLRELATHLQQVREVDRAKLARELHDELGALLTSAKLSMARLKPKLPKDDDTIPPLMATLTDTLNQVIALKRNIIEDLRPSSLDNFGLLTALDILAREFQERSGVTVETNIEPATLDANAQLSLYRMVQESLTNVAKYAQAKQVYIGLRVYRQHVELTVKDDGVGFDQSVTQPKSHGLAGMRHRVESLGGRLDIQSAPGKGTTVFAAFPAAQRPPPAPEPAAQPAKPDAPDVA
ncbi:hypothetical protein CCO03_13355 [Comamonas serinivorans]|uniref:Histidine kinase domain-containing protein n=1 Tax=Comamonas serinivorans TaxID=1082851 RepID=A0A1Y0EPX0_9BURK|nr:CHASE3 domain-containing protein [Comamonas serinivorans]ARU05538.1 hypothetical protein CCO03_13355 [Comamonas serinivorans]